MGVDCKITLPAKARLKDVETVIGALVGLPVRKETSGNVWWAKVDGIEAHSFDDSLLPECANIKWKTPNGEQGSVMYHFEFDEHGNRGIMPRSTALWIAVGRKLVDFFGGTVDYNDSDNKEVDYSKPVKPHIHAENGDEWYALQERLLAVKPITKAEIDKCKKWAAY